MPASRVQSVGLRDGFVPATWAPKAVSTDSSPARLLLYLVAVFLAYFVAGKLGQATVNIRSSNLGPVWPAYGVALAAFLACGARVWPGVAASALVVAWSSGVPVLAAAGQSLGATLATLTGAELLRRRFRFDPYLTRLGDAVVLIGVGAFGSAIISASLGLFSLYATGVQAYSGILSAWLIYWLGDSTGALLITPLLFATSRRPAIRSRHHALRLAALVVLLAAACFVVFADLPRLPIRLHVFAFAILAFVIWAAIDFGVWGASVSVFLVATFATLATALGLGPFAENTAFINAVMLDVLFAVLAVSGLTLAADVAERQHGNTEREGLIRAQTAMEARLHLAAIVESSNDAIISKNLDGIVLSWNAAAERIFGFTREEAVGQPGALVLPPERVGEERRLLQRLRAGQRIERHRSVRRTKAGELVDVSLTISPLTDAEGAWIGTSEIARDITQLLRAEQALSGVGGRLLEAQEQERTRIARELHDDIGQRLSLLAVGMTELSGPDAPRRDRAVELQQQATGLAGDVQSLSRELHSPKLEFLGTATAMQTFCREFAGQYGVRVDFASRDVPSQAPAQISLCLFRVLQEALHNAAKHSSVTQFDVRLWGAEGEIHLVVSDLGSGFDLDRARAGRGLGLISMEERLKLVDGAFSIDTSPDRGTRVYARAPVRPAVLAR